MSTQLYGQLTLHFAHLTLLDSGHQTVTLLPTLQLVPALSHYSGVLQMLLMATDAVIMIIIISRRRSSTSSRQLGSKRHRLQCGDYDCLPPS